MFLLIALSPGKYLSTSESDSTLFVLNDHSNESIKAIFRIQEPGT